MKHRTMLLAAVVTFSLAFAQSYDLGKIISSSTALVGAVQGVTSASAHGQYLPGFGLIVFASDDLTKLGAAELIGQLKGVISGLAPTVQGLAAGDWVSVGFVGSGLFDKPRFEIVVRIKPSQSGTLEAYLDGKKQP